MGHHTYFSLSVTPDTNEYEIIAEVRALHEWTGMNEEGSPENSESWFSHEEDMKEFSKKYPDHLFTLWGKGDENDDDWKCYFKNGKMQMEGAVVTYGEFDESKLE